MKIARRITKSIRPDLEEALRSEADLTGKEPPDLNKLEFHDTNLPFDLGFPSVVPSVAPTVNGSTSDKPADTNIDADGDISMDKPDLTIDSTLAANGVTKSSPTKPSPIKPSPTEAPRQSPHLRRRPRHAGAGGDVHLQSLPVRAAHRP